MPLLRSAVLACLLLLTAASGVAAAEPVPCAEAYPSAGPGGLDLALFCTVDRIRVTIQDAAAGGPSLPPLAIAMVLGALLVVVIVWRFVASRAGKRLAPAATPPNWWVCPFCRSFNPPEAAQCYGCAITRPADALVAPTADSPTMDQRTGRPDG
jgi:hypothetical protein